MLLPDCVQIAAMYGFAQVGLYQFGQKAGPSVQASVQASTLQDTVVLLTVIPMLSIHVPQPEELGWEFLLKEYAILNPPSSSAVR